MGVAAAIIGAAVSSFPALGGAAIAASGFFSSVFVSFLARAAVGLALNALAPKPSSESKTGIGGYRVNGRRANLDHQIIYGETRVGGAIVFEANSNDIVNAELLRVYVHAGHPVEAYREIYINNNLVTGWRDTATNLEYNFPSQAPLGAQLTPSFVLNEGQKYDITLNSSTRGSMAFTFFDGQTTIPNGFLISRNVGWTNQHLLRDCAHMSVIFFHGTGDNFANGVPEITCNIRGKRIYDPRTDTTAWSDNPALCMRDYLTSDYGLNEPASNVDDTLVSTAANVCDQAALNGQKRYTCNGAFTTGVTPIDLLGEMLTSMGGLLWYAQGKWRMKPAYYTAPTIEFTEDDLRSSIALKTRHSRRDNFNVVKGTFKGPETLWEMTDYPEVRNQSFIDADNGQESVVDLNLPFTNNSAEARRIARIFLERNRQQLTVSASFGMRAFQVQVGDIIQLTVDRFGWSQKEFEVASWTFGLTDAQDLQVQMTLREISESVFDEVDDGVVYERDNTNLASIFFVPNVGISLTNSVEIVYEHARNVITAEVSGSQDRIDTVEVQYRPTGTTNWLPVGRGDRGEFRIVDLEDGNYDVRARAISIRGIKGDWTERLNFPARGLATPPAQVANLSAEVNGAVIHLEWDAVADLDLSYYRLRYSSATSGASWSSGVDYVKKVAKPATEVTVPAKAGTYMIKAVDQGGRESIDMTSIVVTAGNLEGFANTLTQTEDPTFSGAKTDLILADGNLQIQNTTLFDDLSGNIDSLSSEWDFLGAGEIDNTSGTYIFSDYIDVGTVERVRAKVDATLSRVDTQADLFDQTAGLLDEKPVNFDSLTDNPDLGDINVDYFVSVTQDDPAGTPTWSDYTKLRSADIQGRAFRFKAELQSDSAGVTPSISELEAVVQYN